MLFLLCCWTSAYFEKRDIRNRFHNHGLGTGVSREMLREQSIDMDIRGIPETEGMRDIKVHLRQCHRCQRKRAVKDFPTRRIPASCIDNPNICLDCLAALIDDSIIEANNSGLEKQIKCPEDSCGLQLTPEDVKAFASISGFRL
jgi:hypothetical protein